MNPTPKRPVLMLLASHWMSMLGAALATTAGFSWLFTLPTQVQGHASNPYIGILDFIVIPIVLAAGLVLIAAGMLLARKRLANEVNTAPGRQMYLHKLAIFFAVTTAANIVIGTQGTYRAVQHMETTQFCGQSCHVMKPEFTGHMNGPHASVACVECHVAPGVSGWVASKMNGSRQLIDVIFNSYRRPIESAMESNRLVPSSVTCEECHWRERNANAKLRVISHFQDDAANTQTQTVLLMLTGGGDLGGIHGKHLGTGVEIRYAAADSKRQTIPWVEYRNLKTGEARTFTDGSKADVIVKLPRYEMQCVDCHNRPTHDFQLPERAVDEVLASGRISPTLPFIKKEAVELLKAKYSSNDEAARAIPEALAAFYRQTNPAAWSQLGHEISKAGVEIATIYNRNVFPDLKVTWGTYPDNLGHTDFPGCFRCHDGSHSTSDGKATITQDCNTCHNPLAVEEKSPEVLKTIGLADEIEQLQEK